MRTVEVFECEICGKQLPVREGMEQHEEMCRWENAGHSVWIEDGEVKHSEPVPASLFGPHDYGDGDGTSDCEHGCGCWMGPFRSGGPVNPSGPCPNNPKKPKS